MSILVDPGLLREITAFQLGRRCGDWTDGDLAIQLRHLDLIRYRIKHLHFDAIDPLLTTATLDVVVLLYEHGHRCSVQAFDTTAARGGPVSLLEWLVAHGSDKCTRRALDDAASNGHLDVVLWLLESEKVVVVQDIESGHPIDWSLAIDGAAAGGHLAVLQALVNCKDGLTATTGAMDKAAANGHVEVLEYLHTHRSEGFTAKAVHAAASNGHLAVVQWLSANTTPHHKDMWDSRVMDGAAAAGHLDVVKWLDAHRREWCSPMAMSLAGAHGHVHVMEFLLAHRRELCTYDALDWAASVGQLASVVWLHEHSAMLRLEVSVVAMDEAAGHNFLDVVEFLHYHRTEGCTATAMDNAAANGHLAMVRWLHTNRKEGCTEWAICLAALGGHLEVVQFLWTSRPECQGVDALDAARLYAGERCRVRTWIDERLSSLR
ncbi:hypothetical protein DYB32_009540 [Aphanomyces invadans]|uniref:Uncharacterized protein n=1 Tax=Aphanomyces invadans TaxID=157072 RepID=A0A3R6YSB7_9STRA|nr:hypothetical protein DYB32_009540 [Aphanomyces invadans]